MTASVEYIGLPAPYFRLYSDNELSAQPPPEYIVKGVIPGYGVGAIYGPSGSAKTFNVIHLGACIRNGLPWFGRRVRQRNVIYIPFEGASGIAQRRAAWQAKYGMPTGIAFLMDGVKLLNLIERPAFIAQLQRDGWYGSVVVLDTLAQAFAGVEENSSEMAIVIGICQDLARALNGLVILVHHSGHSETDRMRGWSGLPAAMDFSICCELPKPGMKRYERTLTLAKVKDGEAGLTFPYTLERCDLGVDADGDPYSSLVVVPAVREVKTETANDAEDDEFIFGRIKDAVEDGGYPSARSLKGALSALKEKRPGMTNRRVDAAIARLEQAGRLTKEKSGPSGNPWLRAMGPCKAEGGCNT